MVKTAKELTIRQLQEIPGVGKSIAQDLYNLGFRSIADIKDRDPEEMYRQLCDLQGGKLDRCLLYVFRCAVYYASNRHHNPELLKWWKWKGDKPDSLQPPSRILP